MHNFYDALPMDVPRAREDNIITHLGAQKSPKVPFWGVNSRFQAKRVQC